MFFFFISSISLWHHRMILKHLLSTFLDFLIACWHTTELPAYPAKLVGSLFGSRLGWLLRFPIIYKRASVFWIYYPPGARGVNLPAVPATKNCERVFRPLEKKPVHKRRKRRRGKAFSLPKILILRYFLGVSSVFSSSSSMIIMSKMLDFREYLSILK